MPTNTKPVTFTFSYNCSSEKMWSAITNIEEMKLWYFDNIDVFKPETGSKSNFVIEHEGLRFTHLWEVLTVTPLQEISYSWQYKEYDGNGHVKFDILETENGVELTLINSGLETFPQHIPAFSRESCEAGWNYLLNNRLREYLN